MFIVITVPTEKPDWKEPKIKSVTPSLYTSHSWQCNASGYPQPTITWYVNATKLKDRYVELLCGYRIDIILLLTLSPFVPLFYDIDYWDVKHSPNKKVNVQI